MGFGGGASSRRQGPRLCTGAIFSDVSSLLQQPWPLLLQQSGWKDSALASGVHNDYQDPVQRSDLQLKVLLLLEQIAADEERAQGPAGADSSL
jgi:hypothetical protein